MVVTLEEINRLVPASYPFTQLQLNFIIEYAKDPDKNGMRAVRNAGYSHSTPGSQSSAAYRLLQQSRIREAIAIVEARLNGGQ